MTKSIEDLKELHSSDYNADRENREAMLDDIECYSGEGQWDILDIQAREAEKRPALTQNQLPKFARQVLGDIREARPSITVSPDGFGSDDEVAAIYNGLVRQIMKRSQVTRPFTTAAEGAVIASIGHFRVVTDFLPGNPFHQELSLEPIHNPLAVIWDGDAREVTRIDARHCWVRETMSERAFKLAYPKAQIESFGDTPQDTSSHVWFQKDAITVAEHFYVDAKKAQFALLAEGSVLNLDDLPRGFARVSDEGSEFGLVVNEMLGISAPIEEIKEADERCIKWLKMSGAEVLEEGEWITPHIPIIPVIGEQIHHSKGVRRISLIRHAKEAQKVYNYGVTSQLEVAMAAPKAPYIIGISQAGAFVEEWKDATKGNKSALFYDDSKNPTKPTREPPPPIHPALVQITMQAAEDLKATTGIYDAALGQASNEKSGVAIRARQSEADIGTNLFADNLEASLLHAGRIMIDAIPKIYDTRRVMRILKEDDTEESVIVNDTVTEAGVTKYQNDLTVGRYDLAVTVGPSATTRREAALQGLERILQGNPEMLAQFIDLIADTMDFPGKQSFVDRARKLLPPELVESNQGEDNEETPEQAAKREAAAKQAAMAEADQVAEIRKKTADADKAEAEAEVANVETASKALELAMQTGAFQEQVMVMISQKLQEALAADQQGMPPQGAPMAMPAA